MDGVYIFKIMGKTGSLIICASLFPLQETFLFKNRKKCDLWMLHIFLKLLEQLDH